MGFVMSNYVYSLPSVKSMKSGKMDTLLSSFDGKRKNENMQKRMYCTF